MRYGRAMRTFVALELPDVLLDSLEKVQGRLPVGRASKRETLHLTLAFVGELPEERIEALHEELSLIRAVAFEVQLSGLGTFGGPTPTILFADVQQNAALAALHKRVRSALRKAGISAPRERFRPHVTLARFRAGMAAGDQQRLAEFLSGHAAFAPPPFRAHHFTLFRSILYPDGPHHEAMSRYPLIPCQDQWVLT